MPRIRCNYEGCIHLEGNFCTAGEVELDQELGCITFSQVDEDEVAIVGDEIEEEIAEEEEENDWEEDDFEEDDEDEDLEAWDEEEDEEEDEDGGGWSTTRRRRR